MSRPGSPAGNQGGGGGGGGQAGAVAAPDGRVTVKIPLFRGDGSDSITPKQWCETLDRAKRIQNWTEEQAADAAVENLRGVANIWRENLAEGTQNEQDAIKTWATLRPKLIERFVEEQTAIQKVSSLLDLKQRQKESTKDFFDRTDRIMKLCMKDDLDALAAADKAGFIACRTATTKLMFLQGLRPEIRLWVEAASQDDNLTLDQVIKAANRADAAMRAGNKKAAPIAAMECRVAGPPTANISAIEMQKAKIKAEQQELAKMTGQSTGAKPKTGQRNRQQSNKGTSAGSAFSKPIHERPWILCFHCSQWGQHLAGECTRSKEEIQKMTRQTQADKPSGTPFDALFPN